MEFSAAPALSATQTHTASTSTSTSTGPKTRIRQQVQSHFQQNRTMLLRRLTLGMRFLVVLCIVVVALLHRPMDRFLSGTTIIITTMPTTTTMTTTSTNGSSTTTLLQPASRQDFLSLSSEAENWLAVSHLLSTLPLPPQETQKQQQQPLKQREQKEIKTELTFKQKNQPQQKEPQPQPEKSKTKGTIRQVSILGERNSGTRWTVEHLKECFGHALTVTNRLTRHKHWFQYDNASLYKHDTLVVAQFRNPYDWLKAMEHVPHHSPAHLRTKANSSVDLQTAQNDWKIFLTKPWTTPRAGKDLQLARKYGKNVSFVHCQEDFLYRDIVSCVLEPIDENTFHYKLRYSEHQPFYEMRNDGSGLPYNNILELRTAKILNFLNDVRDFEGIADVWPVQYEYLLAQGTQHLIDQIAERTGVTPACKAKASQVRQAKKSRAITPEYAKHIRLHLNWTVEEMIGYYVEWKYEAQTNDASTGSNTANVRRRKRSKL